MLEKTNLILICGFGNVGYKIYNCFLELGYSNLSVISSSIQPDWIEALEENKTPYILGDMRSTAALKKAGIETAGALIAVSDCDNANITSALDAKSMNSRIVTSIRMHSQDLSNNLASTINVRAAFHTSTLSAPMFALSVIHPNILATFNPNQALCGQLEYRKLFAVIRSHRDPGLNQTLTNSHAIPLFQITDGKPTNCKKFEQAEKKGDYLFFTEVTKELIASLARSPVTKKKDFELLTLTKKLLNPAFQIKLTIGLVAFLICLSTFIFNKTLSMPPIDALYFAITIITTVGFGDYSLAHTGPLLKLYGCLLMLSGPALIAVIFGMFTRYLLSSDFRPLMRFSKLPRTNHVIIAGTSHLCSLIADYISHFGFSPVIVAEKNISSFKKNVHFVNSSENPTESLEDLNVRQARGLIAVSESDLDNLVLGLRTKELNSKTDVAIRTFDSKLAERLRHNVAIEEVLCASQIAANTFVSCTLSESAICGFDMDEYYVLVESDHSTTKDEATTLREGISYQGQKLLFSIMVKTKSAS